MQAGGFRMPKFELNRLLSYDDEALLAELRRVAEMVKSPHLSKSEFNQHSKASGLLPESGAR
jgi:hypothetical protein